MAEFQIDEEVDITDVVCPVTFVKILAIRLNDGEPVQNVPRSIKEEGHRVLKLTDNQDGTYQLLVKKAGD